MKLNVIIMTKDEPEAFRLIARVCETKGSEDRVIVWDDYSGPGWLGMFRYVQQVYSLEFYQHHWAHSFCNHRNAAKLLVPTGEWILMLDADEWIQANFLTKIKAEIDNHPNADSFLISRLNDYYDHLVDSKMPAPDLTLLPFWSAKYGFPSYPDWQPRLFRNIPEISYIHDICNWFNGCKCTLELSGDGLCLFHFKAKTWNCRYNNLIRHHA